MSQRQATSGSRAEMLERDLERETITAALERAREEATGSVVLVEGGAGIGKTSLLEAGAEHAAELGFDVREARGGELEREIPFGIVRQLFENRLLELTAEEREDLLAGSAGPAALALGAEVAVRDAETASIVHGLYRLSLNLAERHPLLLVIDDVQWADGVSLRFASYLSRRVGGGGIVLLVACRPPVVEEGPLASLAADPATLTVEPAPLSRDAVAEMIGIRQGEAPAEAFSRACHEAGGGNPFLTAALLDALERDGIGIDAESAQRVRAVTPDTIKRSITSRLAQLPAVATDLCAALAILGRTGELRHAAAIAGIADEAAAEATDALSDAGVLRDARPLEFTHPVVREVLYADLGAARRARLHRRAAERLVADGAGPEVVAMHLLECERTGDAWVLGGLRAGAARAQASGAADIAADLYERALAEPPEPPERPALLHALGAAEVLAGRGGAVEHLEAALEEATEPGMRSEIGVELAWAQGLVGRVDAAIETLQRLRDEVADLDSGSRRTLAIEAELATARATFAGGGDRQERAPIEAVAGTLTGAGEEEQVLRACLAFARAKEGEPASEVADLALSTLGSGGLLDSKGPVSVALVYAQLTVLFADRLPQAEREIDAALARAQEQNAIWALGSQHYLRGLLCHLRGDLEEAEIDARTSVELAEAHGYLIGIPASLGLLVCTQVERGELDAAWEGLTSRGLEGPLPPLSTFSFLLEARGRLRVARGETETALDDLLGAGERFRAWGIENPGFGQWRSDAGACAAALGREQLAAELAAEALEHARRFGAPRALGVAERAAALLEPDHEHSIAGLEESVATLEQSEAALERARSEVELGAALRRAGRRREAREPLRRGLDAAVRCGAGPLSARARTELEACGARPRSVMLSGVESLTPSERRVATLAAAGRSNREIAEALFVTRKTVEFHLTGAYRKLDIDSRDDLEDALEG